jgi:hypothetical protein
LAKKLAALAEVSDRLPLPAELISPAPEEWAA